jgi:DNA mismatch endonuclease (patch repair protein)
VTRRLWRPAPTRPYHPRSKAVTSAMMAAVRGRGNRAELLLRRELWKRGLRYRLYDTHLEGRPDLTFRRARLVVFVDGDFWHGRGLIQDGPRAFAGTLRTRRRKWWLQKLSRNAERDRQVTSVLRSQGWRVLRLWESDVLRQLQRAADRVEAAVRHGLSRRGREV